jgi:hypothetical protein
VQVGNLRSYIKTRTASAAGLQEACERNSTLLNCIAAAAAAAAAVQHQQACRQQVGPAVKQHQAAQLINSEAAVSNLCSYIHH